MGQLDISLCYLMDSLYWCESFLCLYNSVTAPLVHNKCLIRFSDANIRVTNTESQGGRTCVPAYKYQLQVEEQLSLCTKIYWRSRIVFNYRFRQSCAILFYCQFTSSISATKYVALKCVWNLISKSWRILQEPVVQMHMVF